MANGTFRITRGRGNAQIPLAVAAALAIVVVLLGRTQSGLFERARAQLTDWMSPALKLVHQPVEATNRGMRGIGDFFRVYQENVRLKEENARLRHWQTAAVLMDERVKRYQLLLHAVPDPALSSVVARVIGRASRPFDQTVVLDAGKQNGVKPGQAVVDARGMIGRIFLAGQHTAWVVLITDLNSRIPVTIKPGNVQAILAGDNSSTPRLEDFSQYAQLKAGDSIVTSGDGGILPAGLALGTLVQTSSGLRVLLQADPQNVDDVEVLDYKAPIEPLPAASVNDLPVTAAGLPPAASSPDQRLAPPPLQSLVAPPGGSSQISPQKPGSPKPRGTTMPLRHSTTASRDQPTDRSQPDQDQ
jgi:rod shape-determining protein MreC